MKSRYFSKAQELSREAVMYGNADKWAAAMNILRRAFQP